MTPSITIDGVNYFAIAATGCDTTVGEHYFVCACLAAKAECRQPVGASACTPNASGTGRSIIHLTKEQHVLAVLLGAEAPA